MSFKYLTLIILFFFSYSFSQNINVEVKEIDGSPISEVNVQLLKDGKTTDFLTPVTITI